MADQQDSVDQHVARWAAFWKDEPAFAPEVEGALVRMNYRLQTDGQVRQWAEASTDDGKTWTPAFDFLYRKVDAFPAF